jgi:hypothetical protein
MEPTPCSPPQRREAERLAEILDEPALIRFLAEQLGVVKHQAQLLLGLCGLAITVTGFSGSHMVQSGALSAGAMVLGIALILVGAVAGLRVLLQVRWVSQELGQEPAILAARVIVHRDLQHRRAGVAGVFVAAGLAAYLLSVAVAAWVHVGGA